MARITRKTQKIFASGASNNGQFGSAQAGTKVLSNDLATLQALPAFSTGWLDAVIGTKDFPALEEFQALDYINTTQLAYLLQQGIPEYDVGTTYFQKNIVCKPGTYQLYGSKTDSNTGNALTDTVNWQFLLDLTASVGAASETVAGIIRIATDAEVAAGTDDTTALSPLHFSAYRVPTGAGMDFWGSTSPNGFIFAYGQIASISSYPNLFAAIGTQYGGDGITTFGIPDKRGRASFGKDNMGGTPAGRLTGQPFGINGTVLGAVGGQEAHTQTGDEVFPHTHPVDPSSPNFVGTARTSIGVAGGGISVSYNYRLFDNTGSFGGGQPFNVVPPGIICNYIIKT